MRSTTNCYAALRALLREYGRETRVSLIVQKGYHPMTDEEIRLAREGLALQRADPSNPLAHLDEPEWQRALDGTLTVGELASQDRPRRP